MNMNTIVSIFELKFVFFFVFVLFALNLVTNAVFDTFEVFKCVPKRFNFILIPEKQDEILLASALFSRSFFCRSSSVNNWL